MLSVVIPTLNAAQSIEGTLQCLNGVEEVVVCDGQSGDDTLEKVKCARVIRSAPGRGRQLLEGAKAANGDWLLFLHADTRLQEGWYQEVSAFCADPQHRHKAAYFSFALEGDEPSARRIEKMVAWRCQCLALPYGDQGLLISRAFYQELGGFSEIPLMEDVDLVRRIGPDRLIALNSIALTSAARYRRDGWWLRPLWNLCCLSLYFLGVSPQRIARLYG